MLLYFPLNSFLPKNLIGLYLGLLSSNQLQGASLEIKQHCRRHKAKIKINQTAPLTATSSARTGQETAGHLGEMSPYMNVTGICTSTPVPYPGCVSLGHNHQAEVMIPEKI